MKWLALIALPTTVVAAAEGDGLPGWAQIVIAIILFLGIATKQLVPGWVYNDMRSRLDSTEAENKRLTQTLLDSQPKTIAALEASTRMVDQAMAELRVLRRVQ